MSFRCNVLIVRMAGSVFNQSIWQGLSRAFRLEGHDVTEVDDDALPEVDELDSSPDLLLAVHGGTVPVDRIRRYRDRGVKTAVYLLDEPYEVDRSTHWSRHYEHVFSVDRATVSVHAVHAEASFLPLGYDPERFRPDGKAYASEILVLGSPFEHRQQLLAPLRARWGRHITWVGPGWQPFCPRGRHVDQLVTPEICARFYRGASVVINIHRDSLWSHFGSMNRTRIHATHLNPRFWEASACGAFQLTSHRKDLEHFFPLAPSFGTSDELEGLLEKHWGSPEARAETAASALEAMSSHRYQDRVQALLKRAVGEPHEAEGPESQSLSRDAKEFSLADDKSTDMGSPHGPMKVSWQGGQERTNQGG